MGKPHVIVVPYPAQGHVMPMLELSQQLESNGVKVTFVNSEFNHQRILNAMLVSENRQQLADLASIPDGMEPWEDRNELSKFTDSLFRVMPGELEALIERINESQGNKITCLIADWCVGWAFDVAEKLGLRSAVFWPASATALAAAFSIPKLLSDGIIDNNGMPLSDHGIPLFPDIPEINSKNFLWWSTFEDKITAKTIFDNVVKDYRSRKLAELIICNSSPQLEPVVFSQFPNIISIGPLLASNRLGKAVGHFWPEDTACLAWLDQQAPNSVVYIAFGSFTVFDQTQFEELAMGLELLNMAFLWVVREDLTADANKFRAGFKERIQNRGQMVAWAPQQQVLSHPSVAVFISHCGWNSTIEGVANGVPFLCWPYFADQFNNQAYICDVWKIGLRFSKDEKGIIRSGEIKDKVEHLLRDKSYKERAMNLQAKIIASVREGCSHKNLKNFIEWIKKY